MPILDELKFIKAVEYADEHYFSKPYAITPVADRWFNQLAVIRFKSGKVIQVSSADYVDIFVEDKKIPQDQIRLARNYYSERKKLNQALSDLKIEKKNLEIKNQDQTNIDEKIVQKTSELEQFDENKKEAKELYNLIVEKGRSAIAKDALEEKFGEINEIMYRPNHGLTHSVRAAYYVTALHAFRQSTKHQYNLDHIQVQKLQLMMLFSVVGRKDETGFADTGNNITGNETYAGFRTESGRAYLKYCQTHAIDLYNNDRVKMYRDSIIVELMGYSSIGDAVRRGKIPEVLVDFFLSENQDKNRDQAIEAIKNKTSPYHLEKLYPTGSQECLEADKMLAMMRDAHQLDLTRCYGLYPNKLGASNSIGIINSYLFDSGFFDTKAGEQLSEESINLFFKLMRYNFDSFKATGQSAAFDLISMELFEKHKVLFLQALQNISDRFHNITQEQKEELLDEAYKFYKDNKKGLILKENASEEEVLTQYRHDKLLSAITTHITGRYDTLEMTEAVEKGQVLLEPGVLYIKPGENSFKYMTLGMNAPVEVQKTDYKLLATKDISTYENIASEEVKPLIFDIAAKRVDILISERLNYNKQTLTFQNTQANGKTDHRRNATEVVAALRDVALPFDSVYKASLPLVSAVSQLKLENQTQLFFKTESEAGKFKLTYARLYPGSKFEEESFNARRKLTIDSDHFKQIKEGKLVTFERVSVPKKITRDDDLVDENGRLECLNLIQDSQALVRLTSTTALNGEAFPDYKYLFNALERPWQERYVPGFSKLDGIDQVNREVYHHPVTRKIYERKLTLNTTDIQYQLPLTQPENFEEKKDSWAIREKRDAEKNTIYTKKLAHSLLPPNGMISPFGGFTSKAAIYFPIGILSDIRQVDLKGERYVWPQNMETVQKRWLRGSNAQTKTIAALLGMQATEENHQVIFAQGHQQRPQVTILENEKVLINQGNYKKLFEAILKKAKLIVDILDNKHYHADDQLLNDFRSAVGQQAELMIDMIILAELKRIDNVEPTIEEIHDFKKQIVQGKFPSTLKLIVELEKFYGELSQRFEKASHQMVDKHAVSLEKLVEIQKKHIQKKEEEQSVPLGKHNEILASNTKSALRALYAPSDTLLSRLNLAYHALLIKNEYQYDVPLLVLSKVQQPYHYTEAKIKQDLKDTIHHIKNSDFPFEQGKDASLQKALLLDIFKLAKPEITDLSQLAQIDGQDIDSTINIILDKMDCIGSLKREKLRMDKILCQESNNAEEKRELFLRLASLGHASLLNHMLEHKDFSVEEKDLEEAIKRAELNKNNDAFELLGSYKNNFVICEKIKSSCITAQQNLENITQLFEHSLELQQKALELETELTDIKREHFQEVNKIFLLADKTLSQEELLQYKVSLEKLSDKLNEKSQQLEQRMDVILHAITKLKNDATNMIQYQELLLESVEELPKLHESKWVDLKIAKLHEITSEVSNILKDCDNNSLSLLNLANVLKLRADEVGQVGKEMNFLTRFIEEKSHRLLFGDLLAEISSTPDDLKKRQILTQRAQEYKKINGKYIKNDITQVLDVACQRMKKTFGMELGHSISDTGNTMVKLLKKSAVYKGLKFPDEKYGFTAIKSKGDLLNYINPNQEKTYKSKDKMQTLAPFMQLDQEKVHKDKSNLIKNTVFK
ncbi:MAG: hypothetical protein EP298_04250 [Gammaproteobacteria bacterium]|nr:MAG: hypothetical protein EP298_04250 [Gammaproteobacteria bacterium]UTW43842.1 hypothetical protein KFE69_07060 [bacterium SCSIO 12844]